MKKFFPIFDNYRDLIYLDNASTTQKPSVLFTSLNSFYSKYNANVHRGLYQLSEDATQMYEDARSSIARFINAEPFEIIFTSGTTDGINSIVRSLVNSNILNDSSSILLSELEHHANIIPWQESSAKLSFLKVDSDFQLDLYSIPKQVFNIIALGLSSNVTGTVVKVDEVKERFGDSNTIIALDCAQFSANDSIDVQKLDTDFLTFSSHKLFGPTGLGVLYINKRIHNKLKPPKFGGGIIREVLENYSTYSDIPHSFEAGTPPIAQAISFAKVVEFTKEHKLISNKEELRKYAYLKLKEIEEFVVYHPPMESYAHPIISFSHPKIHSHDIADYLGKMNICVRSGHHCAQILHRNVFKTSSSVRISIGIYNDTSDIDKTIDTLKKCVVKYS